MNTVGASASNAPQTAAKKYGNCRCCLSFGQHIKLERDHNETLLKLSIFLQEDSCLPDRICQECVSHLQSFCEFRTKVIATQKKLVGSVTGGVKLEPQIEVEVGGGQTTAPYPLALTEIDVKEERLDDNSDDSSNDANTETTFAHNEDMEDQDRKDMVFEDGPLPSIGDEGQTTAPYPLALTEIDVKEERLDDNNDDSSNDANTETTFAHNEDMEDQDRKDMVFEDGPLPSIGDDTPQDTSNPVEVNMLRVTSGVQPRLKRILVPHSLPLIIQKAPVSKKIRVTTSDLAARFALNEGQVLELLNESSFEDSENEEAFPASDEDEEFRPTIDSSSSSSDNEINSEPSVNAQLNEPGTSRSRGRAQIRGAPRRSRGRSYLRARGRGSSRISDRIPPNTDDIEEYPAANDNPMSWTEKSFPLGTPTLNEPSYLKQDRINYSHMDFFRQYFDEELINLIVEKTNQTSVEKTGKNLQLTNNELQVYIGISLIMACIGYPITRMYWETKWRIPLVADNMARNRFFVLRHSLKFVFDNDISVEDRKKDKLWKVRPLLSKVLEACNKEEKQQHISIDEMMIPFTGACSIRQYCPGKPNPVGLKAYVLANPDGTVCDFIIYQGNTTYPDYDDSSFGQGEKAVLKLTESLVPGHLVYFDRYFTTAKLIEELKRKGLESTGTLMKNRIPRLARDLLATDKTLKDKGRGSAQVLVRNDGLMAMTKWYDNKPVLMLSSTYANEEPDLCRRYCKKEKMYMYFDRPDVIKMYNKNMGGVDLADRQLAVCSSRCRTKKWTVRLFSHMLDLSVDNAWIQYKKEEQKKGTLARNILQLRFYKMNLGEQLIEHNTAPFETSDVEEQYEENVRKRGRPAPVPIPSKIRRTQGSAHMPEVDMKQHRCRLSGCDKKTTIRCSNCDLFLCLTAKRNCFKAFHE